MTLPDGSRLYPAIERYFAASAERLRTWLARLEAYADSFDSFRGAAPPAPRWEQDWFSRLDGAMAYAMVRVRKPRCIVEIGAGHSTRFFARAVADEGLDAPIIAVDPAPRASLAALSGVTLLASRVQDLRTDPFAALVPGDVLSIDGSHVLMPGSDVDLVLNRVLPRLPAGVLLHVHDVFLPDAYPRSWDRRGYNEQHALAPLLLHAGWTVEFASHYVATRMAAEVAYSVAGALPLPEGAYESSLWLITG